MFDFLTALFGGIFYYGDISSEKAIEKAREKEWNDMLELHYSISMTPEENSYMIKTFIEGDTCIQKEILESLSDELTEVYGQNWRDFYPSGGSKYWSMELREPWGLAYHILVAKKMHKLAFFASGSYNLSGGLGEERGTYVIKACKIIEKYMQEKYPDLKLWFVPGQKIGSNPTEYHESLWLGELVWEHRLPRMTKKWNPPIKRLW